MALVRATRRVLTGREDVSRATWVAIVAALGVLIATAVSVVGVLRTPEKLTPVTLDPPPAVEQVGTPPGSPGAGATGGHQPGGVGSPPAATTSVPPTVEASTTPAPTGVTVTPTPAALNADFAITDNALLSYGAAVTISNPGRSRCRGGPLSSRCPGVSGDQRGRGRHRQPGRRGVDVRAGRQRRRGAGQRIGPGDVPGQWLVDGRRSHGVHHRRGRLLRPAGLTRLLCRPQGRGFPTVQIMGRRVVRKRRLDQAFRMRKAMGPPPADWSSRCST
ncbi:hypothetical protein NKG94_05340 [Micromonospora sp. M12]